MRICDLDGCENRHYAHGLCVKHRRRQVRNGSPAVVRRLRKGVTPAEAYEHYVVRNAEGCWGWTGPTDRHGYGRIELKIDGKRLRMGAHRVAFAMQHPLPVHLNVLHHCDNPPCTRDDHLYAGTQRENMLDAYQRGRR